MALLNSCPFNSYHIKLDFSSFSNSFCSVTFFSVLNKFYFPPRKMEVAYICTEKYHGREIIFSQGSLLS